MLKNYFKVALRHLRKQKVYAAIKIGGFALSIASCLLIGLYIQEEISFDRIYPNSDRIYRIVGEKQENGVFEKSLSFPAMMSSKLKADFPEVENAGRLMPNSLFWRAGSNEIRPIDQKYNTHEEGFAYADQSLIDILKLPWYTVKEQLLYQNLLPC